MSLVTIIVPIYNVENYLAECLDSILMQSVKQHCAILVDDGSTDQSSEIAKRYASQYPDVFYYIYQNNMGQGSARNTGMKYVKSQYVMFLDSDDILISSTIENIVRTLSSETEEPDIGFMTPIRYNMANSSYEEWSDTPQLNRLFEQDHTISVKTKPEMLALEASMCRCLWRTEFLRSIFFQFPEGIKWEDVEPHFYTFLAARRCIKIDNAGFFYRVNSGKQTTASNGWNRMDIVNVFSRLWSNGLENNWEKIELAYLLQMMQSFSSWSISVAQSEVRVHLVDALHRLYRCIPLNYYKTYEKLICPNIRDRLYWRVLRAPVLNKLLQSRLRLESLIRKIKRLKCIRRIL